MSPTPSPAGAARPLTSVPAPAASVAHVPRAAESGATSTPAKPSVPSGYIPTLDGWRAVAILLVLVAHARFHLVGEGSAHANPWLDYLLSQAVVGVPIFFGISGLLICSRLLEESRIKGSISLRGFYTRRFFRILPPYFLALGAIVVFAWIRSVHIDKGDVLSSLFFFRNYWPASADSGWYTVHFWSLAVEEHFYLILPALLILCGRRSLATILFLAVSVAAWRAIQSYTDVLSPEVRFLTYRTDIRIDGLFFGAAAAFVLVSPELSARFRRWLTPPVLLVLAFVMALGLWRHRSWADTWVALVVPLILLGTVLRPTEFFGRILEWKPLRWIGQISYSLYLWQQIFFAPVQVPFSTNRMPAIVPAWMQELPWNLICVFACATASYYVLERPLTRLGRKLAKPTTEGRPT